MGDDFESIRGSILTSIRVTGKALGTSLERLSTGLRINRASDDAANLALATKFETRSKVLARAYENANAGISISNIAAAAIQELATVATSIRELAGSASSSSLTATQRDALEVEAAALGEEYNRIVSTTTYNGENVFSSVPYSATVQVGDGSGSSSAISFALGGTTVRMESGGSYATAGSFASGDYSYAIDLADMNGDGHLDLIEGSINTADVGVRLGNGDGTFGARASLGVFAVTRSLAVTDFDGDGDNDIIASGTGAGAFLRNNGDGTFAAAQTVYSLGFTGAVENAHLDYDNDGDEDLFFTTAQGYYNIWRNDGSGTFTLAQSTAMTITQAAGRPISVGDVDGDGDDDIIGGGSGSLWRIRNNGGTFTIPVTLSSGDHQTSALADLDGDGDLDVVYSSGGPGTTVVSMNSGSGTFTPYLTMAGAGGIGVELADINGDGYHDIVKGFASGGGITVQLGNGDGTFGSTATYLYNGASVSLLAIGDVNEDGIEDVMSSAYDDDRTVLYSGALTPIEYNQQVEDISGIDLKTAERAAGTVRRMDNVLSDLSRLQAKAESFAGRFELAGHLASQLSTVSLDAADQIRAVDVATEMANFLKARVLSDSQSAMLGQVSGLSESRVAKLLRALD